MNNYWNYSEDEESANNSGLFVFYIFLENVLEIDEEDFESFKKWTRMNIIHLQGRLDRIEQYFLNILPLGSRRILMIK